MRACFVLAAVVAAASGCGASATEDDGSSADQALGARVAIMAGTERTRAAAAAGASNADVQSASVHFGNAYWLARISHESYFVDADLGGLTSLGFAPESTKVFASTCSGAWAAYLATPTFAVVVFRGTDVHGWDDAATWTDLEADLESWKTTWEGPGLVHTGFLDQLDSIWRSDPACGVSEGLGAHLAARHSFDANGRRKGVELYLTGHSLGASLATLTLGRTLFAQPAIPVSALYTFGSPKTGTDAFATGLADAARGKTSIFRFVHKDDLIPTLPRNLLPIEPVSYRHVAYDADGEDGFMVWVDGPSLAVSSFVLHVAYNPNDHDTTRYIDDALTQAKLHNQLH
ncbi:MAG TPA: lipase family protein [Labilithrix sp.]